MKVFNFLLAFQVSKPKCYAAIAEATIDPSFLDDGLPTAIAPYDDHRERAASKCFNRITGKPVPVALLTTYREALAGYHLHSELKFANGDTFDKGLTCRATSRRLPLDISVKRSIVGRISFF